MPKLAVCSLLLLTACTAQNAFQAAKTAECQQYGKSAVQCSGSHSDDWRKLQQEQKNNHE